MREPVLKWKLGNLLAQENATVYALNQRLVEAGRGVSRTTLYRLANEQPERIDLEVAGRVLWGLEQLTGKHYTVSDLLEYAPEVFGDEQALLDLGTADLADALDELEADLLPQVRKAWLEAFDRVAT